MHDLKFAVRQLLKFPGFTATVILTLALGIGANTAIFTLVHAVLLRSLPVADPSSLYRIGDRDDCCVEGGFLNDDGDFDIFSYELYLRFRDAAPEFEQLAVFQAGLPDMNVRQQGRQAKTEPVEFVSGNYFSTFGVSPFAGRALVPSDDVAGATPAAMLSYDAWQADYAGDPSIVGGTVYVQSRPVTIVGIAPRHFFGDRIRSDPPAFWVPLADEPVLEGENSILNHPSTNWLYIIGRVKPGTNPLALQSKLSATLRQWMPSQPTYTEGGYSSQIPKQHVVLVPAGAGVQNMQDEQGSGLKLLMIISGLVLLVACANVANLMLARATTRRSEISVRMALGAARSRLIRQMLTESVVLGSLGGVAGLAFAYAGTRMIVSLAFPDARHLGIDIHPSMIVLGFTFLFRCSPELYLGLCRHGSHPARTR